MPRTVSEARHLTRWLITCAWLACAGSAHALNVFACEPEWASLVKALAPQAQVVSATHQRQDPHHIEARPALIAQMRQADLVVCTGAGLESGWLPVLQQRAGNPKAQDIRLHTSNSASALRAVSLGLVFCAGLIEVRSRVGPSSGDVARAQWISCTHLLC